MNIGSLGIISSAAGSPLSQTKGSETDKAAQDTANQSRSAQSSAKAELAEGIGQTEHDEQVSDRDADGRRLWERPPKRPDDQPGDDSEADSDTPRSRDATGQRGNQLDLCG